MGTGVLFNRDKSTYILTAAHVINSSIKAKKFKKEYSITITRELYNDSGIKIGLTTIKAEILKYSTKIDAAVLYILPKLFLKSSTKFYLEKAIPKVGSEVWHIGSPYGDRLPISLFDGIISYLDRKIPFALTPKDQVNIQVIPGCSGGGVFFKKDFKCIGIVVILTYKQGLFVPIRQIIKWAKEEKIYYLFDSKTTSPEVKTKKKAEFDDYNIFPHGDSSHKFFKFLPKVKSKKKAKLFY